MAHASGERATLKWRGVLMAAAIIVVVITAAVKYRKGEINYYNSDATWHTLLTIEAYNETSISEHVFLPIVSLGEAQDKGIPWGATIPDKSGNYYYTSFSPAGYFLPWVFMKIFRLQISESSLYAFNTLLFIVSAVLWTEFIYTLYLRRATGVSAVFVSCIGLVTYVFTPELLHGMGIVYWHQSVMQVTLLIQFISYYYMKEENAKKARSIFYSMALLNPYIEWTGYVANIGFAIAEFMEVRRNGIRLTLKRVFLLGGITAGSFCLFVLHYLLRVDRHVFFEALKSRFMARNVLTEVALTDVFAGYLKSFLYLWLLLAILVVWNFAKNGKIEFHRGSLLFIFLFPVIENIIMKEHAYSYTYDRMKLIFAFSFLICELSYSLLNTIRSVKIFYISFLFLTGMIGMFNLKAYIKDPAYCWEAEYRSDNQQLADYLNQNYDGAVLGLGNTTVRGYVNLLFGRGVYEMVDMEQLKTIASTQKKKYAIMLESEGGGGGTFMILEKRLSMT